MRTVGFIVSMASAAAVVGIAILLGLPWWVGAAVYVIACIGIGVTLGMPRLHD